MLELSVSEQWPVIYGEPLKQRTRRYCVSHGSKQELATYALRYTKNYFDKKGIAKKVWLLLPVCENCLAVKFNLLFDTAGVVELHAAVFDYSR